MIVYCSSDWHNPPHKLSESVKEFVDKAKVGADLIVGNGDLFDLMEYPWREFVNCKAIQELKEKLEGKKFIYVAGNHDPAKYIRKVISGPNIHIASPNYRVTLNNTTYHFAHGHQWGIWYWLWKLSDVLIIVAPPIYDRCVNRVTPGKAKDRGERQRRARALSTVFGRQAGFLWRTHRPSSV